MNLMLIFPVLYAIFGSVWIAAGIKAIAFGGWPIAVIFIPIGILHWLGGIYAYKLTK